MRVGPVALVVLGGLVGATVLGGIALGLVALFGGLKTEGSFIDWAAVTGVASLVAALGTAVTAATVILAAREIEARTEEAALAERDRARVAEDAAREDRVARAPYLRTDIAFADSLPNGFFPPETRYVFTTYDLGISDRFAQALDPVTTTSPYGFRLVLWVENLQIAPVAVADEVQVDLTFYWETEEGDLTSVDVGLTLAYIAPTQVTAVELGRIRRNVESFGAAVSEVRYQDIFGNALTDYHGAVILSYTGGDVRSERQSRRPRL